MPWWHLLPGGMFVLLQRLVPRLYVFNVVTSITVPFVMTPKLVYRGELGFFFTPMIGRQNVAFNSGCVTCAFLNRKP